MQALDRDPPHGMGVWRLRVEVLDGQWEGSEGAIPTLPHHYFPGYPHRQASWGHQEAGTLHRSGSVGSCHGKRKCGVSYQDRSNRKAQVMAMPEHRGASQQDNTQGGVWKRSCVGGDERRPCRRGSKKGITNSIKDHKAKGLSRCDENDGLACNFRKQTPLSFQERASENSLVGRQSAGFHGTERPRVARNLRERKMEKGNGRAVGAYCAHKKKTYLRSLAEGVTGPKKLRRSATLPSHDAHTTIKQRARWRQLNFVPGGEGVREEGFGPPDEGKRPLTLSSSRFQRNIITSLLTPKSMSWRTPDTLLAGSGCHGREKIASVVSNPVESRSKHSASFGYDTTNTQQDDGGCGAAGTYFGGNSASDGDGMVHVVETVVTVVVKDINDNAPVFPNVTMVGQVQENVAAGE